MKFRPYNQQQTQLFPNSLEELISEDDLVRYLDILVEQLNLTDMYDSYSEEGQPGYHPKMLLKLLFYGYATGVRSSRKIADKTKSDICFMYLAAMQRPDFRTVSDFRLNKRKYLDDYFNQILKIIRETGLYSINHIAIDGSKIKANASKKKTKSMQGLIAYEDVVKEMLDEGEAEDKADNEKYGEGKNGYELPNELSTREKILEKIKRAKEKLKNEELKRVNLTDSDANFMKKGDGGVDLCYNTQIAVDADNQIITTCQVSKDAFDNHLFIPVYEASLKNTNQSPTQVTADAGYYSGLTYKYLEQNKINAFIPESNYKTEIRKYDRRNFRYDEQNDKYICPGGRNLRFHENGKRNGVSFKIYKSDNCLKCKLREECISKPNAKTREIHIYENDEYKQEMRKKLKSEQGRKIFSRRKAIVEPVFAQLKFIMGFDRFLLRGIDKVKSEFMLICCAYNIKKLAYLR